MPFEKGNKLGKGRPKGSENKVTRVVKDAVQDAFDELGGAQYLLQVARDDPKTFCGLLGRVIPTQVNAELKGDVQVVFETIIDGKKYVHSGDD